MEMGKSFHLFTAMVVAGFLMGARTQKLGYEAPYRIHTLFSVECQNYFDWETVGLMHSFHKAKQPGPITRLLSCTEKEKKDYKGMDLAPTMEVPSWSVHPTTGDWYPAINKPVGVVHWLEHSEDAKNVDWVVILDADMIIRGPIIPWELGAEKGKPVAAYYGYLVGCDNVLAEVHTKHPELCDKVGGLLVMHIDDLRALAPMWLSKTEEVRADKAHWPTKYTGDIYARGWISEMYGYSFGAAEVGLRHKITDNLMIYPGYTPREGIEPILMHYGLPFHVGNWSFSKLEHHEDTIVYECGKLFPEPPYPKEVIEMESDPNKRREYLLSIECVNTLNEGLLLSHAAHSCPKPKWSKYLSFLKSKTFKELTGPKQLTPRSLQMMEFPMKKQRIHEPVKQHVEPEKPNVDESEILHPKIHTIFSTECTPYFDWQTVGLVHSFHLSGQPGNITRLLSCTDEDLKQYKGRDLAPTHYVPSMSRHPLTGDWYPAINKPAAVVHWLNHVKTDAEYIVILDADMIMRGPITPWEFNATKGHPVSTPYDYLIGCDTELAKLHTQHPDACDKVGGVIIMHINDLKRFAPLWLHKTEEVRADTAHWSRNYTGDIYDSGWISEMYGYSFGAAELNLRHVISKDILIYPGYIPEPGVKYRVFHYGLEFGIGNWSFDKAKWRHMDIVDKCGAKFPDPPNPSTLDESNNDFLQRDLLSIECANALNEALRLHYERRKCSDPNTNSLLPPLPKSPDLSDTSIKSDSILKSSRKFGKLNEIDETSGKNQEVKSESEELSIEDKAGETFFSSMRVWIIGLWALSIVGFMAVMILMISRRKKQKKRGKGYKTKRRTSNSGFWDVNGHDRPNL